VAALNRREFGAFAALGGAHARSFHSVGLASKRKT